MKPITMKTTVQGSPDGIAVHTYLAGQTYGPQTNPPMTPALVAVFVKEGWADDAEAPQKAQEANKAVGPTADKAQRPSVETKPAQTAQAKKEVKAKRSK